MFRPWKALLKLPAPWKPHHSQPSHPQSDPPPSIISPDLLHSNRSPNEAEVTETHAYTAQLKSTLVRLQRRRSKCAFHLREPMQKLLGDHISTLSPFRRLPYEIITMIFLMCPQGGNLTDAPLVLCRICRQWRNIALDTPRLWCSPRCVIRLGRFDREIAGLVTWLKRSGCDHPLNLSLNFDDRSFPPDRYIELFEVAKSVSLRWKSLAIYLSNVSSMFDLIYLDATNLPQLKSLTILNFAGCNPRSHPTPHASHLFSAATGLRALTIEGITPTTVPRLVFVKNLTNLHMRSFRNYHTPEEYLQLLEQCPNLTHCAIHCLLNRGQSYVNPRPRTLPKLVHLQIEGYCPHFSVVGMLLDALTIPQLEFVSIDFLFNQVFVMGHVIHGPPSFHPRELFLTFIERSVHTLSLINWSPPSIPTCFSMVASVGPARTIWKCDGEWHRTNYPDYCRRH